MKRYYRFSSGDGNPRHTRLFHSTLEAAMERATAIAANTGLGEVHVSALTEAAARKFGKAAVAKYRLGEPVRVIKVRVKIT